jgi:hypothetical protein
MRCFIGQICRSLFVTRDSPVSLPDGSGCGIGMIGLRVLGQEASHLLLIRTDLGYGTVLTAACALQCCSASGLFFQCKITTTDCFIVIGSADAFFWER